MIKKEFKFNLKSFIIWTSILVALFLLVFLIYPYIMNEETTQSLDDMLKSFSPEMLKAFNMDVTSINTAYGWLKSEGFMFVLLIIGFYSSLTGSSILLKEENDLTIEYLSSLPIKRNNIVTNKVIVGITNIILMTLLLGIFNYICLVISGDFNQKEYILLSLTPILIGLPLFGINLFISTFFHKTKKTLGISLGLVFLFYILNILSELSTNVEFLKYFSIYTLADNRNVITNCTINPVVVIVSIIITSIFIIGTYIRYDKKELI